jgi:hypothetical protein
MIAVGGIFIGVILIAALIIKICKTGYSPLINESDIM